MPTKRLVIALAGNPNSGKTTVFNNLTGTRQKVGNWPGVTVEKKEGHVSRNGYDLTIVDLPGTYSLTPFSIEEVVARNFLLDERPDVVIDIIDASNLERSLYLATQIRELDCKVLFALNMADVGVVLMRVAEADQAFVRVIAVLLVTVFLLKAALLPLGFWLPQVYTAATLPVAGLFVIMTKVGIYALLRVATIGLAAAPFTADLLQPWLPWLALATIAMGSLGVLAAKSLSMIVANLVVVSAGTLLLGVADLSAASIAALLYYLVQTTMVTGALFLFADALARQRGAAADWLKDGPKIASVLFLGIGYLVLGMAASGAPPLTGFLGKVMVMQSLRDSPQGGLVWAALLVSGLISMLALARAASVFFWESGPAGLERPSAVLLGPAPGLVLALSLMLGAVAALTVAAGPVSAYSRATADQLLSRPAYVSAVIGDPAAILRERRP